MLITSLLILNKGANNHSVLQEQAAALLNLNERHTRELSFKASPREEDGLRCGSVLRGESPSSLPLCHCRSGCEASSVPRAARMAAVSSRSTSSERSLGQGAPQVASPRAEHLLAPGNTTVN